MSFAAAGHALCYLGGESARKEVAAAHTAMLWKRTVCQETELTTWKGGEYVNQQQDRNHVVSS